ncbi:CFEM domain-containing protein [Metarhizium album ARSEF 1941]|uniref:CFEM domain-containing protein n=1 Tax=Metarhizium album (strain ARSEF 1941) TaxID=1081103 RepID=A0A0B2WNJ0_METAS|nr:CFEM domain-containing protein [Metarhizium album ARSEF 1941]KHN95538.1 CFEM domain-containing protein [Metarhizium album ARSEF 1941]
MLASMHMESGPIVHLAAHAVNITQLPACAWSCVAARCDLTNVACICQNEGYRSAMGACMFQACGLSNALLSKNLTSTLCNEPVRDNGLVFTVVNFLLGSLAFGLVMMRLFFKQYLSASRRLGLDDWTILAALVLGIPSVVIQVFFLAPNGLGRDIWTLDMATLLEFGRYFYVMEILYLTLITLVKVSLSLFYLSIFPGNVIRRLLWVTVAFHVASGLAFVLKTVLQCTPVEYNWERFRDDPPRMGRCVDMNASGWVNGVVGVVADIWLFALPLTQLRKLRLHWKKKVGAAIMFLTGAIVTIVSMLRLKSLVYFGNSYNPTWDQWSVVFWSTIEVSVAFICACMPALRLVLVRMYPRTFRSDSPVTSWCCVSRNACRCSSSRSRVAGQGSASNLAGLSRSKLLPDQEGELGAWDGKVRIRPLQALPAGEDGTVEPAATFQTSTYRAAARMEFGDGEKASTG